jgi:hypothetical protein
MREVHVSIALDQLRQTILPVNSGRAGGIHMFNPVYLRDLSCRLHLLARDCLDIPTANELGKTADEIRAKADDAERLHGYVCTVPNCTNRASRSLD